jgi:hypothetical protein
MISIMALPALNEDTALALELKRNDLRAKLSGHADKAVRTLVELSELGDSEAVRLAAAVKILALVGVGEIKETRSTNVHVDLSVDREAEIMIERLERNRAKRQTDSIETTATDT